jgi:cell division protein FtsX
MSSGTGYLGRALITGLLAIATLGFGLAGLCGGVFTVMSVSELFSPPRHESYAGAVLFVSVPCLLIGALVAWLGTRALARMFTRDA